MTECDKFLLTCLDSIRRYYKVTYNTKIEILLDLFYDRGLSFQLDTVDFYLYNNKDKMPSEYFRFTDEKIFLTEEGYYYYKLLLL